MQQDLGYGGNQNIAISNSQLDNNYKKTIQ